VTRNLLSQTDRASRASAIWSILTLKSSLGVTGCHWKRHHSIDHTRLTIIRRWILWWPWNVG